MGILTCSVNYIRLMNSVYYVKSLPSYEELSTSVKGMTKRLGTGYVGMYSIVKKSQYELTKVSTIMEYIDKSVSYWKYQHIYNNMHIYDIKRTGDKSIYEVLISILWNVIIYIILYYIIYLKACISI